MWPGYWVLYKTVVPCHVLDFFGDELKPGLRFRGLWKFGECLNLVQGFYWHWQAWLSSLRVMCLASILVQFIYMFLASLRACGIEPYWRPYTQFWPIRTNQGRQKTCSLYSLQSWGLGVLPEKFGVGVRPTSQTLYPIYHLNKNLRPIYDRCSWQSFSSHKVWRAFVDGLNDYEEKNS